MAFAVGNKNSDSPLSSYGLTQREFESEAKEFLGIPYRKGGTSTRGLDCSGFARMIYDRLFGIDLPHSSFDQFKSSDLQKIATRDLQPGDLIFFGSSKKKRINHVGVYLSDGQFIHASTSQGVMVSSLDDRYWKKRFVGSKRHLALNSDGDASQVRFESSVEIPLYQNGTLTGFTRDEFRTESSLLQVDFNTFTDNSYETLGMEQSHLNLYEVGYDHALADGFNMNFTAIHETFDSSTAVPGFDSSTRNMSYRLDDGPSETGVRQGLKLASNFQPSDWLMITPSITYFDYSLESDNSDLFDAPTRTLGLNTLLTPDHNRWSLSMLLQYSDQDNTIGAANMDNMLSSLNMGVKLGINLTDNLQFSIIGKHDKRTATYGVAEETTLTEKSNSDVFLTFDLYY